MRSGWIETRISKVEWKKGENNRTERGKGERGKKCRGEKSINKAKARMKGEIGERGKKGEKEAVFSLS